MQVIAEKLSTTLASMAIKDGEELDLEFGLLVTVWLDAWLFEVKHD